MGRPEIVVKLPRRSFATLPPGAAVFMISSL